MNYQSGLKWKISYILLPVIDTELEEKNDETGKIN